MLVGRIFKGNYFSLPPPPIFHKLIFFAFCTRETIPCPITDLEELITEEEVEHYSLKVYAARYFGKQDARGKAVPVHQLVKFSSVKPPLTPFSPSRHSSFFVLSETSYIGLDPRGWGAFQTRCGGFPPNFGLDDSGYICCQRLHFILCTSRFAIRFCFPPSPAHIVSALRASLSRRCEMRFIFN